MHLSALSWPRLRPALVLAHRWAGLLMAGFLLLAGLTGAMLAWNEELEAWVSPQLFQAAPPAPGAAMLDPLVLRQTVQDAHPEAYAAMANLKQDAGHAAVLRLISLPDPKTGKPAELLNDQVFIDPYTGQILGERKWGDIGQGLKNLMPFIYRLHYSLALDVVGTYIFGIVALLWTLDCFVGAYLSFPAATRKKVDGEASRTGGKPWLARWWPSWKVRWSGGSYKLNFDLHRAGGLWPWAMLLVLAWSGVAFNLYEEVYEPVMHRFFAHQDDVESLPAPLQLTLSPQLNWSTARGTGRRLMAEQGQEHGFAVHEETLLVHDPRHGPHGIYRYQVKSSRDIRDRWGSTQVIFDADTGELLRLWLPTGAASADTIRTWLTSLHMAALWGIPFRVFMTGIGLIVAMLSMTGAIIWARKRGARVRSSQYQAPLQDLAETPENTPLWMSVGSGNTPASR